MDHTFLFNRTGLQSLESQIGVGNCDTFIIGESCLEAFDELKQKLDEDDLRSCEYRLNIFQRGFINQCLPLVLLSLDSEDNDSFDDAEKEEIFCKTLQLLARLSQPLDVVQAALPSDQRGTNTQNVEGRKKYEFLKQVIDNGLEKWKVTCLETSLLRVVLQYLIQEINQDEQPPQPLIDALKNTLWLLRNLLHLPDPGDKSIDQQYSSSQQLVMILLENGITELIWLCLKSTICEHLTLPLVQFLAVFICGSNLPSNKHLASMSISNPTVKGSEENMSVDQLKLSENMQPFCKSLIENDFAQMLFHVKFILVGQNEKRLSPMYYVWLLEFCLHTAIIHALHFNHIKILLSPYVADFLVNLAVTSQEQFILGQKKGLDVTTASENVKLAVQGLNQLLLATSVFSFAPLDQEDKEYVYGSQYLLCQCRELRETVVWLLRAYKPGGNLPYLEALVNLNHTLLMTNESLGDLNQGLKPFNTEEHMKSLSSRRIFETYTEVLVHAGQCSLSTLEQAFMFIHGVTMELGHRDFLLHLPFVQAVSSLDSSPFAHRLSQGTVELMHFILENFFDMARTNPQGYYSMMINLPKENSSSCVAKGPRSTLKWTNGELEQLEDLCAQVEENDDYLMTIVSELKKLGIHKDESEVMLQIAKFSLSSDSDSTEESESTAAIVQRLHSSGFEDELSWLQEVLLESVFIRLGGCSLGITVFEEPVIMHHIVRNEDIPLVTYTEKQEEAVNDVDFGLLLSRLGIKRQPNHLFHRVPISWDIPMLIRKAETIAPINYERTKFKLHHLSPGQPVPIMSEDSERERIERPMKLDPSLWLFHTRKDKPMTQGLSSAVSWWKK